MSVWHRIGLRIRHPRIREGHLPEVVPPLGVICLVAFSVFWLVAKLIYSFQLELEPARAIALALLGGVAPICLAYGIVTNRWWTRALAVFGYGGWISVLTVRWNEGELFEPVSTDASIVLTGFWLLITLYLYTSRRARKYYLLIYGKEVPPSLSAVDLAAPLWVGKMFEKITDVAEWLLVALALFIAVGYFVGWFDSW